MESASIFGMGTVNGSGTYDYRIYVSDPDSTNGSDTYGISLSNGSNRYGSGTLALGGGTIEIHKT